jgi:hypothetical protein
MNIAYHACTRMEANNDPAYQIQLRKQILDTLAKREALSFEELMQDSAGAFPTEVRSSLRELCESGSVAFDGKSYRRTDKAEWGLGEDATEGSAIPLPESHPLDFDWRFTPDGRRALISQINRYSSSKSKLALFGAPSLFLSLAAIRPNTYLFDRNTALTTAFATSGRGNFVVQCDLRNRLHPDWIDFDFVLADPPWYPDYYEAFIDRASELLRVDGILFVSVLQWLTRPNASADRRALTEHALSRGFDVIEVVPTILEYETPRFERAALEKAGISVRGWRHGDLFIFRNVGKIVPELQNSDVDMSRWNRFVLGSVQVQVVGDVGTGSFDFSPVVRDSPVLTSVSRRSSLRSRIHIWTSGNLAYSTTRPEIVRYAIEQLEAGRPIRATLTLSQKEFGLNQNEIDRLGALLEQLI